jgi:hypothetical protein
MTMRKDLQSAISGPFEQLARAIKGFDPNQARDDHGRWTNAGGSSDKSDFTEADHDFIAKHGERFVPALNEAKDNYGMAENVLDELLSLYPKMGPSELGKFIEDHYEGEFDDDEEIATNWLFDGGSKLQKVPEIVLGYIDLDGLGSALTDSDGPLMSILDNETDKYHVFKRPTKG